jgi:iron complex outermembrane receptor protein
MLRSRTTFAAALLAATAFTAVPAFAQNESDVQATDSTSAAGQSATSGEGDIIVTARRRAENIQDVPISITVATGESLVRGSISSFIDIQRTSPALRINPASISATTTNLSMRGQALVDIRLNIDPAVAIYQDGVYLPRAQGSNATDLVDIARVEVLAGPQGTLYGKNTTGGLVAIYTNVANTDGVEGFVRGRYAEHGEANVAGMINLPLSDRLAVRVVGSLTDRSGYGVDRNGNDIGTLNSRLGRVSLLWEPTDNLTITLRGDYTRANVVREAYDGPDLVRPYDPVTGAAPVATLEVALEQNNLASTAAFAAQPLATRLAQLAVADATLRSYFGGDPDNSDADQASTENVNVWGVSSTIDYEFSNVVSLKAITAYRGFLRRATQDLDGTPFQIIQYPFQRTRDRQFSQELQLNFDSADNRLNAVFGGFYADEEGDERVDTLNLRIITAAVGTTIGDADVDNQSLGLFAQASYRFTDQLSFTGGLRWSKDDRSLIAFNRNNLICQALGLPLATTTVAGCRRPMEFSDDAISYTASLEWRPTDDIMLYAKTSRGYRVGGLQQAVSASTPAQANLAWAPFQSETVTDYEIGFRGEWLDRRLRTNVTFFHALQNNAIRSVSTPVPGGGSVSSTQNAAKAVIDGIEWDLRAVPTDGLELGFTGSWTDARFKRYVTPTGEDRSALPILLTPEWQVGALIAYTAQIGVGSWRNQLDMTYTDRQLAAEGLPSEVGTFAPARTIFNFRTSLEVTSWDATVSLFVRNLTNRRALTYPVDVRNGLGIDLAGGYTPPRTFGIEILKNF